MLKVSDYNFIWPVENSDKALIYNSFKASTMEIRNEYLGLLDENKKIEVESLNDETRRIALELEKAGFLTEDFVDEKSILRYRNSSGKYSEDLLSLTIIPTFNCNLKCFYCYQERTSIKKMPPEVQEGIVQYVSKAVEGVRGVNICWFGGEPLLAWDEIEGLSRKLIEIADKSKREYNASIITNGYLFNDEKIGKLRELRISDVQITLDGPPSMHSERKGITGDPEKNFDKILTIIEKLLQNDLSVSIRVNIDKTNMDSVEELLDILSKRPAGKANIYPAQVTPYTSVCRNVEDVCLKTVDFAGIETEFYRMLLKKGLLTDLSHAYPQPAKNFCCSDQVNSFTIGPDGYVYKCWSEIDGKKDMVFDVLNRKADPRETKEMKMRYINWITWNPFEFEDCVKCKLLPLCMGGCPHNYKTQNTGKPECMSIKENLEQMIRNHYYCVKIKKMLNL